MLVELPDVEDLRKSRYRIVHGLDPTCRFICARRTRRRTRRFGGNGRICATRRFGGNGKCADQWYCAGSSKRWWNEQCGGRSQRIWQRFQDSSAPAAAHSRGGDCADGGFAKPSRTFIDELGPAIAAGCTGRPPPAARRSSALGEKPDESERSTQSGERGARPHDQRHLPRLLNIRSPSGAIKSGEMQKPGRRWPSSLRLCPISDTGSLAASLWKSCFFATLLPPQRAQPFTSNCLLRWSPICTISATHSG